MLELCRFLQGVYVLQVKLGFHLAAKLTCLARGVSVWLSLSRVLHHRGCAFEPVRGCIIGSAGVHSTIVELTFKTVECLLPSGYPAHVTLLLLMSVRGCGLFQMERR